MPKSNISKLVSIDKEMRQDTWELAETIARIIDPSAFSEWVVNDPKSSEFIKTKIEYQKAIALHKAHEVLKVLNMSEDIDWYSLLEKWINEKE